MIGFLSPQGDFIKCNSWEHTEKARNICLNKYNKDFFSGQQAEDYLLSLGYLVIRATNAFMTYLNEDNKWNILTNEQLYWLEKNAESFNDGQKKDLNEILHDQKDIRRRHGSNG